jgi:hypothetical protein
MRQFAMSFDLPLRRIFIALSLCLASLAVYAQSERAECDVRGCVSFCGRFDKGDPRQLACENYCRKDCGASPVATEPAPATNVSPPVRSFAKKGEMLDERKNNALMIQAISQGNLKSIRRLIEKDGLNPTYVYAHDFDPKTRQFEGTVVRLRLTDIFNDANELRGEDKSLDKILELFVELGLDVSATFEGRTAWGPSLKTIERARDREARLRAFELAMAKGLKPNADLDQWLFDELPQVCGRDRSEFAIRVVELLIKHYGTTIQEDFWRAGQRGPETVADVLDRLISRGNPRNTYEKNEFAAMDVVWQNCTPLARRVNRFLTQGN